MSAYYISEVWVTQCLREASLSATVTLKTGSWQTSSCTRPRSCLGFSSSFMVLSGCFGHVVVMHVVTPQRVTTSCLSGHTEGGPLWALENYWKFQFILHIWMHSFLEWWRIGQKSKFLGYCISIIKLQWCYRCLTELKINIIRGLGNNTITQQSNNAKEFHWQDKTLIFLDWGKR
jgi:hypothetical protein